MEAALATPRPDTWPLVVLHLDFKTNERAHHRAIWELLGRHERWLTTAPRVAGDATQPFTPGPLLVLTENGAGQSAVFYDEVPVGGRLRIFGTVPPAVLTNSTDREAQFDAAINASPETLIPSGTTNYRRWINFSWMVVERGGQARAADWTTADDRRLRSIVSRAHDLGLWVRFYTLNGHASGRRTGLDGQLQLRIARGGSAAMARGDLCRHRFHRHGSIRGCWRPISSEAWGLGLSPGASGLGLRRKA